MSFFKSYNLFNNNDKDQQTVLYYVDYRSGGLCDILKFLNLVIYLCEKHKLNLKILITTYLRHFLKIDKSLLFDLNDKNKINNILTKKTNWLKYYSQKHTTFRDFVNNYKNKYLIIDPVDLFRLRNIDYELPIDINYKDGFDQSNIFYNILDFINFNDEVYNRYNDTIQKYNVTESFYCIHLRCGDKYLESKPINTYYCGNDKRYNDINNIILRVKDAINSIDDGNTNKNSIILFCDNSCVKKIIRSKFKNIIIIDSNIIHVGYDYSKTDIEHDKIKNGFIDTLVDFIYLINSKETHAITYSGFSLYSAFLSNKRVIKYYE